MYLPDTVCDAVVSLLDVPNRISVLVSSNGVDVRGFTDVTIDGLCPNENSLVEKVIAVLSIVVSVSMVESATVEDNADNDMGSLEDKMNAVVAFVDSVFVVGSVTVIVSVCVSKVDEVSIG